MYILFYTLSLLPLRVLYLLSDVIAWLARCVVRYRVKVVRSNLLKSFPEKSETELREIERGYYRFLCDYFVETVKMTTMSEKQMRRRFTVENIEELNDVLRSGGRASLFLGHYCNWEWVSSLPLHIDRSVVCAQIYHPLENRDADRCFLKIRSRWGAVSLSMEESSRRILAWSREKVPNVVGYISDQIPGMNGVLVLKFLNQTTGFYTGGERITVRTGAVPFYLEMRRPRRGYYVGRIVRMGETSGADASELTLCYARMLENEIRRAPQYWLWSHRRWKRHYDDSKIYSGKI